MAEAIQTWNAVVHIVDHDGSTTAGAVPTRQTRTKLQGYGRARRNPADVHVPEIGEVVAVAGALRDLADTVFVGASEDVPAIAQQEAQLRK